jgi:tricorn protease
LRFPSVRGDLVAFVAEDDVWLAPIAGGRAWRLTADRAPAAFTQLSPDGTQVAFTSRREGAPEVHVAAVDGGPVRRLSFWADESVRVLGWADDGRVLAASSAGTPFRSRTWAYSLPLDGGRPERLPYGPVSAIAAGGPGGATVLGVAGNRRSAAAWKRYRGGQAGRLWIDRAGSGDFVPLLADLDGQLENPGWIGDRLVLLSDHEGWGNVYSSRPDGTDLRRHSDHGDAYARAAGTDGQRLVYQCLGELWLVDDLTPAAQPRRLEIQLGGPRWARVPYPIDARGALGDVAPDHTGRASAVEVRGTIHWLTHRDGPARALADQPGVRSRLPRVLGGPTDAAPRVAWVTDADGDDAIEIRTVGGEPGRRLASGQLGRALEMVAAPDGDTLAVASHDGRLLLVDVATGDIRSVISSEHGDVSGLAFSPDSRWLAWSHPGPSPLRQIKLARLPDSDEPDSDEPDSDEPGSDADGSRADAEPGHDAADTAADDAGDADTAETGEAAGTGADGAGGDDPGGDGGLAVIDVTALRFTDTEPVFTLDGKHLAFLSARTFDPVYDEHVFDMSFPVAVRPHLLPLAATTPSPFDPQPGGRPVPAADPADASGEPATPEVVVDADGLDQRAVPLPVPAGRYGGLQAARDGLIWLQWPVVGVLGDGHAEPDEHARRTRLQRYDFRKRRTVGLAEGVDGAAVTGDGRWIVQRDGSDLRLVPADRRVEGSDDEIGESTVDIELDRLRVRVDPAAQWRQMYDETGRLMRDHFWIADMAGVDWAAVLDRYRPVLDRVSSRDDLSELIWEVLGELGTSHAYEHAPERPADPTRRLGHLGADLTRDADGRWLVDRVLPGESSAPAARSPLAAPGVAIRAGDEIVAVDGRPVDPSTGPAPLLVGAAGVPVELTVRPAGAGETRQVVVEPLLDDRPLRYHAWVADRRAAVHAISRGRVGYLHIPDMTAEGWAQLHRDLHLEVAREALLVDVRNNGGGHVSELVLERLSRTVQGWDVVRHGAPEPYPRSCPRGPLVAVANEHAGSDGDIVVAMIKQMRLGPVVGTRTWGGVIGIDMRYRLVDGTSVTQPRYSFWFDDLGWTVENHGVAPDIEVQHRPQDWAAGTDPQLDTAIQLALDALATRPASTPPDPSARPSRAAPTLPPRP